MFCLFFDLGDICYSVKGVNENQKTNYIGQKFNNIFNDIDHPRNINKLISTKEGIKEGKKECGHFTYKSNDNYKTAYINKTTQGYIIFIIEY